MDTTFSLRERKKYQTMQVILDTFLSLLENSRFDEIHIEEVCSRVAISKVTFFRYFASKEEVLDYFVLRWCYERSVEIGEGTRSGEEGIRHVFQTAASIPRGEKILLSIIQYYAKLKAVPKKKERSGYERRIISQNVSGEAEVRLLPLEGIFDHYLGQIGEILPAQRERISRQLVALFYGVPFQVHLHPEQSVSQEQAYRDSLDLLFG
ncbi:TetR/AcrR family transcriptional regulator [Gorillibacterium massiliense]|uniref:TetR/AcrR family transcriptional regulator n=1 Tax=Gorillibacterium massiliense TaxID=1280390 RepID=UPI0004BC1220|nr:TetR/AcrR family transcriptional regulator [Gorillibacterium massiliense]